MTSCSRRRCTRDGTHQPVLILAPSQGDRPPAQVVLGILVCKPHTRKLEVPDLIHADGWAVIDRVFTVAYGAPPDHDNVGLVFHRAGLVQPLEYPTVTE